MWRNGTLWRAVVAVGVVGTTGVGVWARQAAVAPAPESMAALTAEVKALRLSIEAAAKDQQHVQGLGVYLSVQKDRLLQVVARLDTARRDTANAAEHVRDLAGEAAGIERYLAENPAMAADERAQREQQVRALKADVERARQAEMEARNRESLAEQAVATEEARWNDLVARLEASIRR